jgi:hypothetical protein
MPHFDQHGETLAGQAADRVTRRAGRRERGDELGFGNLPDRGRGGRNHCRLGPQAIGFGQQQPPVQEAHLGGAQAGEMDKATQGQPGKYTFCCAENEDANPWQPLHIERGFDRGQDVVTVVNTEAPHSMTENVQTDATEIMRTFAS